MLITVRKAVALRARVLAVFLGLWSAGFACVHMAWALGWRWGVPSDAAPISERPWFLTYDLVAGLIMYAAAAVCVAFYLGRETPMLHRATAIGSVLALLRGVPALVIDVAAGSFSGVGFGADVWFTTAGLAGLALLRVSQPGSRSHATA